jgi:WD40 repeat protein
MLHHLSELCKAIYNGAILSDALNTFRGQELKIKNQSLNNILLVYKQPAQLNGDFSSFDFSNLDLRNCVLTEYTLSNDEGKGAIFSGAIIGEKTFQKAAHTKPVVSAAMSPDGKKLLSCGKDKVLLWDFPTRSVEREIHVYPELMGGYDKKAINQVAFSRTDNAILYTDGETLIEINLDTNNRIAYTGATSILTSLLVFVDKKGNERYYACDSKANVLCWHKGSQELEEFMEANDDGIYKVSEYPNYTIVLQNLIGISIINESREVVIKAIGDIEYEGLYSLGTETRKLIVLKDEHSFLIYDLSNNKTQTLTVDFEIYKVMSSFDENYLIVVGLLENTKVFSVYSRNTSTGELLFNKLPFVDTVGVDKQAQILSVDVYKNKFFYGLANGKIFVGYFYRDDCDTYKI